MTTYGNEEKILEEHLQTLKWHEADPRAVPGSSEAQTWGIHPNLKPPKDAVDYVIGRAKREVHRMAQQDKLMPEWRFAFIVVTTAHFLWLRSKEGAAWLLRFYGIEEPLPFLQGYRYYLLANNQMTEVGGATPFRLRIFRSCARDVTTLMVGSQTSTRVEEMKKLIDTVRSPYARMPFPHSEGAVFHLVSKYLQDWFFEPKPDFTFPYQKPDRITGFSWAKHLRRDDTHLVYPALEKMEMHQGGCYRISPALAAGSKEENPNEGVLWVGRKDMRILPLIDVIRRAGSMGEHDIRNVFECSSCGHLRPCLPVSEQRKLCCMCYGSQIERDNRPTLDYCTRLECKNCPSFQSDPDRLNMLKSRLNREVEFPSNRYR